MYTLKGKKVESVVGQVESELSEVVEGASEGCL